jgi:transcriptional regulator with XRE-family HTH domain
VSEDAPEDWVAVGKAIRRRRNAAKMTQRQLGESANVGETTIRELEHVLIRKRAKDTLELISMALDLPATHFDDVLAGRLDDAAVRPASLSQVMDKLTELDDRLSAIEAKQLDILHYLAGKPDVELSRGQTRHLSPDAPASERSRPTADSETA